MAASETGRGYCPASRPVVADSVCVISWCRLINILLSFFRAAD